MKKNIGKTDRLIRVLLAIALSALIVANLFTGTFAFVLLGLAAYFLITGMVNFCPFYKLAGINTCKTKE